MSTGQHSTPVLCEMKNKNRWLCSNVMLCVCLKKFLVLKTGEVHHLFASVKKQAYFQCIRISLSVSFHEMLKSQHVDNIEKMKNYIR